LLSKYHEMNIIPEEKPSQEDGNFSYSRSYNIGFNLTRYILYVGYCLKLVGRIVLNKPVT